MVGWRNIFGGSIFFAVVGFLSACAPISNVPQISKEAAKAEQEKQLQLAAKQYYVNTQRVHAIAYKILKANAELCKDNQRKGTGIYPVNKFFFKKDYRKPSEKSLGMTDQIRVLGVAPGSAGEKAGVREGDQLVSLNGWVVPSGKEALKKLGEKFKELSKGNDTLLLTWKRDERYESADLKLDTLCNYGYGATENPLVNAFADGKNIRIEGGMMNFVKNDVELATTIGHEIAHNMMDHISKMRGNQAIGLIVDILFAGFGVNTQGTFSKIGIGAFSQEFESEADYVGLYFMARAGYNINDAPNFWRRMALMHPGSIKTNHASSHPATPQRFLGLEKTVEEIKAKQAAGIPLFPDKKKPAEEKPEKDDPYNQ